MSKILDKSYDKETGEITQFLVFENGQPDTKIASPENMLLYDPEDELPFDGGMKKFLSGDSALRVSESPEVLVAQNGGAYSYILKIQNSLVETMPNQATTFLEGLYEAIANEDLSKLQSLHADIMKNQVRRDIINALITTFDNGERIDIVGNGWLVDGFYLVDWNAKMYVNSDDTTDGDYIRSGGEAVKKDTTYEFVRLSHSIGMNDSITVKINGESYTLTEREVVFLSKVKWLLHRRHYHPDQPFWRFTDRWADVNVETGEPENDEDEEPNLNKFNL